MLDSIAKVITQSLLDLVRPTDVVVVARVGTLLPLAAPQVGLAKDTKRWLLDTKPVTNVRLHTLLLLVIMQDIAINVMHQLL
jgi:hypothetical protein